MSRIPKERDRPYDRTEPKSMNDLMSELISLRGWGRVQTQRQMNDAWEQVIGEDYAALTKVTELSRGVLHVVVFNSALLSELVSFRKHELLERLQADHSDLKIKDIKFKLRGKRSR